MEVVFPRCCGIDVHKSSLEACIRCLAPDGHVQIERAHFAAHAAGLDALAQWLSAHAVDRVVMESTGVYWKPVYNRLEEHGNVWVVNAQHVKAVPGRKTDCQDAEWLAQLVQFGLLRPSFIPDRYLRALRDLTRTRTTLRDTRAAVTNRIHALLDAANLKLGEVVTDILGVSGRAMLAALAAGVTDPEALADLAKGRLRRKRAALVPVLTGALPDHQRLVLRLYLDQLHLVDAQIDQLNDAIAAAVEPYATLLAVWDSIPGVDQDIAQVLLAEIGPDMTRFASASHLASWAGMCPGSYESAGKRHGGKTRKGSPWLRRALVQAAHGAARTRHPGRTALAEHYQRLLRRGKPPQKAAVAVGHRILVTAYHLARDGTCYAEPDPGTVRQRQHHAQRERALKQLRQLGYAVTLTELGPTA